MSGTAAWITAIATAVLAVEGAGAILVWMRRLADPGKLDKDSELREVIDYAILEHTPKSKAAREVKESIRHLPIRERWQRWLRKRSRNRDRWS